mmetsp:Transcript_6947/g.15226  ORF Transcript_6947/g.15226 Transcript_6947/m.15226 type:complete len:368 (+) Transcript_6947:1628-2731(+)
MAPRLRSLCSAAAFSLALETALCAMLYAVAPPVPTVGNCACRRPGCLCLPGSLAPLPPGCVRGRRLATPGPPPWGLSESSSASSSRAAVPLSSPPSLRNGLSRQRNFLSSLDRVYISPINRHSRLSLQASTSPAAAARACSSVRTLLLNDDQTVGRCVDTSSALASTSAGGGVRTSFTRRASTSSAKRAATASSSAASSRSSSSELICSTKATNSSAHTRVPSPSQRSVARPTCFRPSGCFLLGCGTGGSASAEACSGLRCAGCDVAAAGAAGAVAAASARKSAVSASKPPDRLDSTLGRCRCTGCSVVTLCSCRACFARSFARVVAAALSTPSLSSFWSRTCLSSTHSRSFLQSAPDDSARAISLA